MGPFLWHLMDNKWEQYQQLALGGWVWRSMALLLRDLNQTSQKMWKEAVHFGGVDGFRGGAKHGFLLSFAIYTVIFYL
jgi:hypothetical protein